MVQKNRLMKSKRKNKDYNPFDCGVTHFLNLVGGKWKVLVIYGIIKDCNRFSLLHKIMPQISKQMLINQLRELEQDKIIERKIYAEMPPRVEYMLTKYGKSLMSLVSQIQQWGDKDLKKKNRIAGCL